MYPDENGIIEVFAFWLFKRNTNIAMLAAKIKILAYQIFWVFVEFGSGNVSDYRSWFDFVHLIEFCWRGLNNVVYRSLHRLLVPMCIAMFLTFFYIHIATWFYIVNLSVVQPGRHLLTCGATLQCLIRLSPMMTVFFSKKFSDYEFCTFNSIVTSYIAK